MSRAMFLPWLLDKSQPPASLSGFGVPRSPKRAEFIHSNRWERERGREGDIIPLYKWGNEREAREIAF